MSLYPLSDDFLSIITETVERLAKENGVQVVTNQMSTQITGEFDAVMNVVRSEVLATFQANEKAVFVCKFLNKAIEI